METDLPFSIEQKDWFLKAISGYSLWISSAWINAKRKYRSLKSHLDEKFEKWEEKVDKKFSNIDEKFESQNKEMMELIITVRSLVPSLKEVERVANYLHDIKAATSYQDHLKRKTEKHKRKMKRMEKNLKKL